MIFPTQVGYVSRSLEGENPPVFQLRLKVLIPVSMGAQKDLGFLKATKSWSFFVQGWLES